MSFNTPLDVITFSLKAAGVVGVGQTAAAEDANDAFTAMNGMLAQWQRKRWLIWHLNDVSIVCTGAQSYSVGPGGDFNIMRPDRLEGAYFRQLINSGAGSGSGVGFGEFAFGISPFGVGSTGGSLNLNVDFPLEILESREDYSDIALKTLVSFPRYIFYDSAFPIGSVYPWPIPQASIYELHLLVKETLNQFVTLNQTINLAPEYEEALWTNLAARLAPIYQLPPRPDVIALAREALNVIRGANTQIPRLIMPKHLTRGLLYNIYSDQNY